MKNIHKEFYQASKNFLKIRKKLIIVGGGRWAGIILNEVLKNFKNIKLIYVVTQNENFLSKISKVHKKKILLKKNFNFLKNSKIKYAIIANKNRDHFKTTKELVKKNINVLVEKPLVENIKNFHELKNLVKDKKKCFVSSPFFFSYYFYYLKKNFVKNNSYKIKVEWHDKINEIRNGDVKKHDFKIKYLEDTIYHLFGILACFFGLKKIKYINSYNFKNKGKISLKVDNSKILLNCSRLKNNERVRTITFNSSKENFKLNFSDDNNLYLQLNGFSKKLNFNFCQKTLKFQIYFFLKYKNFSNYYIFNQLNNLDNLFSIIKMIKKNK